MVYTPVTLAVTGYRTRVSYPGHTDKMNDGSIESTMLNHSANTEANNAIDIQLLTHNQPCTSL